MKFYSVIILLSVEIVLLTVEESCWLLNMIYLMKSYHPPINLELIIIKIISSSPIIYCVAYIPPKSSAADEYLHELYEFLITLKSISDSLVLLGD